MASRLYSIKKANPTKITNGGFFGFLEREYSIMLAGALQFRKTILLIALVFFGCSIWMTKLIGVEFMPQADEGEIRVDAEMAVGTRIEVIDVVMQNIEKIVRDTVPEAEIVYYRAGGGGFGNSGAHTGEVHATLVPSSERKRSAADVAKKLRSDLAHIPGVVLRVRETQGLFVFRILAGDEAAAEVQVRGYDLDIAKNLAHQVKEEMEKIDGISVAQIARAIETSLTGTSASMYRDSGDEYKILVRLAEADRLSVNDVLDMTVTSDNGKSVVLKNVVSLTRREGPVRIEREDQQRIIKVSGNIAGRDFGSVMADVKAMTDGIAKPSDFEIVLSGQYEEQQKAFFEMLMGFCLAIILVYMVMASQFESLRDPFIVMFSIPLALIGVVITMLLTDTTFNVQSFMGCIMLTGIVVNNAIILVDYTNLLRHRDKIPLMEAIVTGSTRRLRPIMMTTLTTVVGLLPLAIGWGDGGEVQAPMARVVIGGLLSSTLITLFIIPILYSYIERKSVEPS
jgi:HAE1 family hydrophobic/amphiphilic exporter-1